MHAAAVFRRALCVLALVTPAHARFRYTAQPVNIVGGPLVGATTSLNVLKKQTQAITGPASHDRFGSVVASIPDVNGDGRADAAVAANPYGAGRSRRVFVYSGATGALLRSISSTPSSSFAPVPEHAGFGASIAGLADVNGDGRGDIAIGDTGFEGPHEAYGRILIHSGATGKLIRTFVLPVGSSWEQIGTMLAAMRDVDGDRCGDLIVGSDAYYITYAPYTTGGRVFIVSGRTGSVLRTFPTGIFMSVVAGAPDLTGDQVPDVLVGMHGEVRVYSGASGELARTLDAPANTGQFGWAISTTPDADGDSVPDVVIGAPSTDVRLPAHARNGGRAFLVSGRTGAILFARQGPAIPFFRFGASVAGVPDIDGDGRGDFAVAGGVVLDSSTGVVYVYSGATGALLKVVRSPNGVMYGGFGASIAGLPDTNGNGRGELLIGAPREAPGSDPDEPGGRAYIVRY